MKRGWDGRLDLIPIGDVHRGNDACSSERFHETIDWIAGKPNAMWIGMGDYGDFIGYRDSRFDPTVIDKVIPTLKLGQIGKQTIRMVSDELRPIATRDRCLGLLEGNHERKYEEHNDCQNLMQDMCDDLGVPFLTYSCFQELELRYGRDSYCYTIRAHHGAGYAQTKGGKMQKLKKFAQQTDADLTLMGHLHDIIRYPQIELLTSGGRIQQRERLAVMTGSYLKAYKQDVTTYAEIKAYDPVPLGSPTITLTPFERHPFLGEV